MTEITRFCPLHSQHRTARRTQRVLVFFIPGPGQDSVLQLGIVSSYPSRGGIKVCSRPLWGLISAGYQGIIGGRAAKRQFTPRTEDRALPHGPPRYHSNSLRFRRTRAPRPPAVARAMHPFRQSQLLSRARCLSWRARSARRGGKRGVVSGVKGNPPGYQPIL